jgi:hypothetical protein
MCREKGQPEEDSWAKEGVGDAVPLAVAVGLQVMVMVVVRVGDVLVVPVALGEAVAVPDVVMG